MKRFSVLMVGLVLAVGLVGCGGGVDVRALEGETMIAHNEDLEEQKSSLRVTEVHLAHENGNKYSGYMIMNDGQKLPISVVYDGEQLISNPLQ